MGLKPVFDSNDEFFNVEAAQAAYELVSKMDRDEAEMFTTFFTVDLLWDTIEKNQRTLQRHLNNVVAKRMSVAQEVLGRREDGEELSKALEEISKSPGRNPYYYGYTFDENKINRDRRTGQFKTKVRYNATKPANDRVASRLGVPTRAEAEALTNGAKLGRDRLAYYQEGFAQVSNFLQNFQDNGLAGDTDFIVTYESLNGPRRTYSKKHTGTDMPEVDPSKERIVQVDARPSGLTAAGASFGLVSALGGSDRAAYNTAATMGRADAQFGSFADSWVNAGDEVSSSNDRLYGRVKSGSDFVGHVAPAGSKLQIAAGFGSLVGEHGPQAERVLGPRARLTMYRYRGTEKNPDSELTREYDKAMRSPRNVDGSESGTAARRLATMYMASKIPNQKLYDLNLKAGHTPPSEGLIIDKNGKIVTQAIGYGDDHYLPFNLKNLKGLRGGEYIRTRSVGGPTTEDIYTGLIAGAQRVTVVSRSGTFVVEFDDTFRGTRRYNDKAGRMVNRYGKLVDAVKSQQVVRQPLEPSVRQAIRDDVERTMGWASPAERKVAIKRREDEFKLAPRVTAEDERMIEAQVKQAAGDNEVLANKIRAQLRNQVMENKAYNYQLNGDGYAAAITALQEQFPYYIADVRYTPRKGVGTFETETDQGYVKPRHNRPDGAWEGYFDEEIAGRPKTAAAEKAGGKYKASSADYQNWKYNPQNVGSQAQASDEGDGGVPTRGGTLRPRDPSAPPQAKDLIADELARKQKAEPFAEAGVKLRNVLRGVVAESVEKDNPVFKLSDEELRAQILDGKTDDLEAAWNTVSSAVSASDAHRHVRDAGLAYETAKGRAGGTPFDRTKHLNVVPKSPFEFPGTEYLMNGDPEHKLAALNELSDKTPLPGGKKLANIYNDAEFITTLKDLHKRRDVAQTIQRYGADSNAVAAVQQMGMAQGYTNEDFAMMVKSPELIDDMIENTNRAWTLRTRHRDAVGDSLDRLFATPSAERGELPKVVRRPEGGARILIPPSSMKDRQVAAAAFEKAAAEVGEAAEQAGDKDLEELANDLYVSRERPDHVESNEAWRRYQRWANKES